MKKSRSNNIAGVDQIAEDLGVSKRQVQYFALSGMPRAGHGKYDRVQCLIWYIRRLKAELKNFLQPGDLVKEQTRVQKATVRAGLKSSQNSRIRKLPLSVGA